MLENSLMLVELPSKEPRDMLVHFAMMFAGRDVEKASRWLKCAAGLRSERDQERLQDLAIDLDRVSTAGRSTAEWRLWQRAARARRNPFSY